MSDASAICNASSRVYNLDIVNRVSTCLEVSLDYCKMQNQYHGSMHTGIGCFIIVYHSKIDGV